ncbi:hypothetical protein E4U53_002583 [Claviceps sorghi]|nr:hypothetical protein E4U53_002583 [Claviceps sorghi]
MAGKDFTEEKKRPVALNLTPTRSNSSSTDSFLKVPRTPRFAEATSVHSPVDMAKSPFADPEKHDAAESQQPGVVGFGYISNGNARESSSNGPRSPLKSAMKVPGTPARPFANPLSPTFREEEILEKREAKNDQQQAKDIKIKTRVRMAKFALRGVNFGCSLIILSMLSTSFAIFNSTKSLAAASKFTPWAPNTQQTAWPQKLTLSMACLSLFACILVFCGYCRGGHKRATKVNTYYTMFAVGWFVLSMLLWIITAVIFQHSRDKGDNKDMWGWACVNNQRAEIYSDKVDYVLVCRLQNWTLICIVIEIVVEVISISLYSIVFYRYYSKRRLMKSMDMRDRARSDLYLAQLRSQSAPNTPGFGPKSPGFSLYGHYPKSPAAPSTHAMSPRHPPATYRNLADIEESTGPFSNSGRDGNGNATVLPPPSMANRMNPASCSQPAPAPATAGFKLQAPPVKAPCATPKTIQAASPPTSPHQHAPQTADEPTYESVPIPHAYTGQAIRSPRSNRGLEALEARKWDEAIDLLSKALLGSTNPAWLLARSRALISLSRHQEALEDANLAFHVAFDRSKRELLSEAHYRRAVAHFRLGQYANGDCCCVYAMRLCKDFPAIEKEDPKLAYVDEDGFWTATLQDAKREAAEEPFNAPASSLFGKDNTEKTPACVSAWRRASTMRQQCLGAMEKLPADDAARKITISVRPERKSLADRTADRGHDGAVNAAPAPPRAQPSKTLAVQDYQTNDAMTVSIFSRGVDQEKLRVEFLPDHVRLDPIVYPDGEEKEWTLRPYSQIDPAASSYKVTPKKIELRLAKKPAGKWPRLRKEESLDQGAEDEGEE